MTVSPILRRVRLIRVLRLIAPLIVLILAAAVRFHNLGAQSLWNDEGNSLRLAQRPVGDLIEAAGRDIHPPGYYLVLKGWIDLAGDSEFSLRALSAFEGVLAVAVTIALGRVLFGRGAGVIAGLLVALSPFAVYYSQETRMYAQLGLLSAASMLLLVRWVRTLWMSLANVGEAVLRQTVNGLAMNNKAPSMGLDRPNRAVDGPFSQQPGSSGPGERDSLTTSIFSAPLFALAVCNAAGLYTQYSYAFTLLAQGVLFLAWVAWRGSRAASFRSREIRRAVTGYAALNLVTLALFAPWLPTAWDQVTTWPRTGVDLALREQLRTVFTWITYGSTAGGVAWLRFLFPGLLVLAALWPDRRSRGLPYFWRAGLPLVWAGIVIGALFASGAYRAANLKFLLPAQIALSLLIGWGARRLWEKKRFTPEVTEDTEKNKGKEEKIKAVQRRDRRARREEQEREAKPRPWWAVMKSKARSVGRMLAAVCVFLVIVGQLEALDALYHDPAYARADYRAMAAVIDAAPRPGDAVILDAPNQSEVFTYYYHGSGPVYDLPRGLGGDDAQTRADVEAVIRDHRRIFVLFWGEQERDPRRVVQAALDAGAYPVASAWYGDVRLAQYAVLAPPPTAPDVIVKAQFGDHITLTGYALSAARLQSGDVLGVTLFWTTSAPLSSRYKVTVQLLAPDGSLVSQHDAEPGGNRVLTPTWTPGQTVIDQHGLAVPPGLAPGEYTVIVGLYDIDAPLHRLPVMVNGTAQGDHLVLQFLSVTR